MSGHYMRQYRAQGEGIDLLPALADYAHLGSHVVASRLVGTNRHKEMIRGFYHLKEAWYADTALKSRTDGVVDELTIGFYGHDGNAGTTGEFGIRWKEVGGEIIPRLEVFDDAWDALAYFSDLLAEMARLNDTDPTPAKLCTILKKLGIKDLTPRTQS